MNVMFTLNILDSGWLIFHPVFNQTQIQLKLLQFHVESTFRVIKYPGALYVIPQMLDKKYRTYISFVNFYFGRSCDQYSTQIQFMIKSFGKHASHTKFAFYTLN